MGNTVPTTPKHEDPVAESVSQLLVRRSFAPSDLHDFAMLVDEYTVWIPDGGKNDELGAYLLVIAYKGDTRVASGELFDFHVTADRDVWLYDIALEDYKSSDVEEWGRPRLDGPTNDCLRYERQRIDGPTVVSIVRDDDSDCDTFLDRSDVGTDCEPLLYCDGSGNGDCVGKTPCVHGENACSIGSCSNKDGMSLTCQDDTCVSDALCATCDLTRSPAEILECALLDNTTHPSQDLMVTTEGSTELCNIPTILDIALPFPCANPTVDAVSYYMPSAPFDFAIETGPMQNTCRLTITPATADIRFRGVPHLLVTVELVPPRRTGFVLGLIASGGACPLPGDPIVRSYAPNIGTCPMP